MVAKFQIGILAIVISYLFCAGCGKDDSSPTAPPQSETGNAFIDSVVVEQIPFTNETGGDWDVSSGPDLFFYFTDASGNTLSQSPTVDDLTPSDLPINYFFDEPYPIMDQNWNSTYYFRLYDYDSMSGNDYIGVTSICINTIIDQNGKVRSVTLHNQSQTIRMRLVLHWN
ncbi:MAG: hypothetical protein P9M15_04730 [Candidatus Electryoneaceae bacterium]|nr:hypothetical protein [Candidatus Electryoneaceae bacterium]